MAPSMAPRPDAGLTRTASTGVPDRRRPSLAPGDPAGPPSAARRGSREHGREHGHGCASADVARTIGAMTLPLCRTPSRAGSEPI